MTTPLAGIPELIEAQAEKHLTVNHALRSLEALSLGAIKSLTLLVPPTSPSEGDIYIPAVGATGAWAGLGNKIVQWSNGGWQIYEPWLGARLWSSTTSNFIYWAGSILGWLPLDFGNVGNMLKSTYDTNNNGIVDNAEKLNNQTPAYYLNRSNHVGGISYLDVSGLGTAATLNAGSSANQLVQLLSNGKLPAIDGSNLINLPSGFTLTLREVDNSPVINNVTNIRFDQSQGFVLTDNLSGQVTIGLNLSAYMLKSTYDPDNDGKVNLSLQADKVLGVDSAGNNQYYGTNGAGVAGFYALPSGGGASAAFEAYEEILTADKTLSTSDKPYLYFDPNGSDRTIYLPSSPNQNQFFRIRSDSGTNIITIRDSATIVAYLGNTVNNGEGIEKRLFADFHYVGTTWRVNIY